MWYDTAVNIQHVQTVQTGNGVIIACKPAGLNYWSAGLVDGSAEFVIHANRVAGIYTVSITFMRFASIQDRSQIVRVDLSWDDILRLFRDGDILGVLEDAVLYYDIPEGWEVV